MFVDDKEFEVLLCCKVPGPGLLLFVVILVRRDSAADCFTFTLVTAAIPLTADRTTGSSSSLSRTSKSIGIGYREVSGVMVKASVLLTSLETSYFSDFVIPSASLNATVFASTK